MDPSRSPSPPTKRLLQELRAASTDPPLFLQHLGPKTESQLFEWEAVMRGPSNTAYENGLWHLTMSIPTTYPLVPPQIRFDTRIIHPNISFQSGEICLDLLKSKGEEGGWTPAYTIGRTLEAIWLMLRYPEVDSPWNVDVAVLLRNGDAVAAEGLVRWACAEWRWRG